MKAQSLNVQGPAGPRQAEPRITRPRADGATPIRKAVVARARRLLAQGYYDNTHVLAFAVARMIDDVRSRRPAPKRTTGVAPGRHTGDSRPRSPLSTRRVA